MSVLTSVKSSSSLRFYEVLKKEAYKIGNAPDAYTQVEYNIAELRFMIGLANIEDEDVKRVMGQMGKNVDWDLLYKKLDKNKKI